MSWLFDYRTCIFLGWIVSPDAGCAGYRRILVERAVWSVILTPGITSVSCVWCWCFTRCSWCVLIILLSIWYKVSACHSPVYHYITATAVYHIQRFITACGMVMWSQSLYLSRMNSQCGYYVCCKSASTRRKSCLRWNTHGVDKHHHVCLECRISCICELPQDITMFMWTTIVNSPSQVADHPKSSPCWVDRAGPVLTYRTMHLNDVMPASSPIVMVRPWKAGNYLRNR